MEQFLLSILPAFIGLVMGILFLNRYKRYRILRSKTAKALVVHAPVYFQPGECRVELVMDMSNELRGLAGDFAALAEEFGFHFWLMPNRNKLLEIKSALIGLSNSTHSKPQDLTEKKVSLIKQSLKLLKLQ